MKKIFPVLCPIVLIPGLAFGEYPSVAVGETVTLTTERTETAIAVSGTLEVAAGGKGALAAASTVTLGSPDAASAPALVKVSGGAFGSAHNGVTPTTVDLGAAGGRGRFLVTGGKLGVEVLNISSATVPDESGYIDFLRLEGGTALFRRSINDSTVTARVVVAGSPSTFGPEHGWYPTMFSGKGPFLVESENGALINIVTGNSHPTLNATPLRIAGAADCRVSTHYGAPVTFGNAFRFDNAGGVFLKTENNTAAEFRFKDSGFIGDGVTNVFLQAAARLVLQKDGGVTSVRDLTAQSAANLVLGSGTLVADASGRDIAVDAPFGGTVTLRKTGSGRLTLGPLTTSVPTFDFAAGDVTVRGKTSITNFSAAAGTTLAVDGGELTFAGGSFSFAGETLTRVNGGTVVLQASADALPTVKEGFVLEVNRYRIDGVEQPSGDYPAGAGIVRVLGYPYVRYGETIFLSESKCETSPVIEGRLVVTAGTSATAKGTTVRLGSPADDAGAFRDPAVLEVRGGKYGEGSSQNAVSVTIGESGGRGQLVSKGGEIGFSTVRLSANAATNVSGYVDYARVEGGRLTLRSTANDSVHTGRVVFAGTSGILAGAQQWYGHTYTKGAIVVEALAGSRIAYYFGNQQVTFNDPGVSVRFRGTGDTVIEQETSNGDTYVIFNRGCFFDSAGELLFTGAGKARFAASGLVGPNVTRIALRKGAYLSLDAGTENVVRSVAADAASYIAESDATLVLDAAGGDVTFDAAVRGGSLVLVKTGSGALTFGVSTTNVPCFSAPDGGALRILGDLTTGEMTLGGTSDIVVDGGRWMVGPGFVMAGGTVSKTNGGSIVVHATSGAAPVFPSGVSLTVNEYWLDGVRQDEGVYAVGGATVTVSTYNEASLAIWRNDAATPETVVFPSGSRYLGLALSTPPAALTFKVGPVSLGSAGIAVDDGADLAPVYDFDLPLEVAVGQTWSFGSASAVFRGPIDLAEEAVGSPSLEISSSEELVFAGTNSTFCGDVAVSGRLVRVSGVNALGSSVRDGVLTLRVACGSADTELNACSVSNAVVDRPVVFDITQPGTGIYGLRFEEATTNTFNGFVRLPKWTEFEKGSYTEFNGGVRVDGYNRQRLREGAVLVFRGGSVDYSNDGGNHGMSPLTGDGEKATMVFDCEIGIERDENLNAFGGITFDMRRDYALSAGKWRIRGAILLNGHPQRATRSGGSTGRVSSTNVPAFVELALPAGETETNALRFADLAGFRMTGGGCVRLDGVSTSTGTLAVENGTVELGDATWLNAANVAVSGSGVLRLTKGKAFGGLTATLALSDAGTIDVPAGIDQRFMSATVTVDGEEREVRAGTYGPDASGLMAGRVTGGGTVTVGAKALLLIVR